jgi:hypothetical protein
MISLRPLVETRHRVNQHRIFGAPTHQRIGAGYFPGHVPRTQANVRTQLLLLGFGCVLLIGLGTACDLLTISAASPIPITGAPPGGHWEVVPLDYKEFSSPNEGWKTVRIGVALENQTFAFSSPSLQTEGTKLFTDPAHSYAVETFKTTGVIFTRTNEISFLTLIPVAYRIKGEYQNDTVVSYYFQAQIPEKSKPSFLLIANSGGNLSIPENPSSPGFLRVQEIGPLRKPGTEVNVAGKATLQVGKIDRTTGWPSTHDKISARIILTNTNVMTNTKVALRFFPLDDTGIVGAPFEDKFDCQALLEAGPGKSKESKICVLVPHTANRVHLFVVGDTYEVYDIWPPSK